MLSVRARGQRVRLEPGDGHTIRARRGECVLNQVVTGIRAGTSRVRLRQGTSQASELERGDKVVHASQAVTGRTE